MALTALPSIEAAIVKSRTDFCTYVWPEIRQCFPAGQLHPFEGQADEGSRQLDILGIDYLYAPSHGEGYGVSQRTGEGAWRTVTMNEPTIRRWSSMCGRSGALLPAVHVQAYLGNRPDGSRSFLSATVIRVDSFVSYIDQYPGERKLNQSQGTHFRTWTFDELDDGGVSIVTVPARQLEAPFGPSRP